jgi:hypothetical protein
MKCLMAGRSEGRNATNSEGKQAKVYHGEC